MQGLARLVVCNFKHCFTSLLFSVLTDRMRRTQGELHGRVWSYVPAVTSRTSSLKCELHSTRPPLLLLCPWQGKHCRFPVHLVVVPTRIICMLDVKTQFSIGNCNNRLSSRLKHFFQKGWTNVYIKSSPLRCKDEITIIGLGIYVSKSPGWMLSKQFSICIVFCLFVFYASQQSKTSTGHCVTCDPQINHCDERTDTINM